MGFQITSASLKKLCRDLKLYSSAPELNDVLHLQCKGIVKLENLDEYTGLKTLYLEQNAISTIENLDRLVNLRCLYLGRNAIVDISGLECLTQLDTLDLSENYIATLTGLSNLKSLKTLNLSGNKLTGAEDVAHLAELPSLTSLDLANNVIAYVDAIDVVAKLPLSYLRLMGNPAVREYKHYRKRLLACMASLNYLDESPCFPRDVRLAKAFVAGGVEAERAEREVIREEEDAERERHRKNFDDMVERARKQPPAQHDPMRFRAVPPGESDSDEEGLPPGYTRKGRRTRDAAAAEAADTAAGDGAGAVACAGSASSVSAPAQQPLDEALSASNADAAAAAPMPDAAPAAPILDAAAAAGADTALNGWGQLDSATGAPHSTQHCKDSDAVLAAETALDAPSAARDQATSGDPGGSEQAISASCVAGASIGVRGAGRDAIAASAADDAAGSVPHPHSSAAMADFKSELAARAAVRVAAETSGAPSAAAPTARVWGNATYQRLWQMALAVGEQQQATADGGGVDGSSGGAPGGEGAGMRGDGGDAAPHSASLVSYEQPTLALRPLSNAGSVVDSAVDLAQAGGGPNQLLDSAVDLEDVVLSGATPADTRTRMSSVRAALGDADIGTDLDTDLDSALGGDAGGGSDANSARSQVGHADELRGRSAEDGRRGGGSSGGGSSSRTSSEGGGALGRDLFERYSVTTYGRGAVTPHAQEQLQHMDSACELSNDAGTHAAQLDAAPQAQAMSGPAGQRNDSASGSPGAPPAARRSLLGLDPRQQQQQQQCGALQHAPSLAEASAGTSYGTALSAAGATRRTEWEHGVPPTSGSLLEQARAMVGSSSAPDSSDAAAAQPQFVPSPGPPQPQDPQLMASVRAVVLGESGRAASSGSSGSLVRRAGSAALPAPERGDSFEEVDGVGRRAVAAPLAAAVTEQDLYQLD